VTKPVAGQVIEFGLAERLNALKNRGKYRVGEFYPGGRPVFLKAEGWR
jgi:hypothetical protein